MRLHDQNWGFWNGRGGDSSTACIEMKALIDQRVVDLLVRSLQKGLDPEIVSHAVGELGVELDMEVREVAFKPSKDPLDANIGFRQRAPEPIDPPKAKVGAPGVAVAGNRPRAGGGQPAAPAPRTVHWSLLGETSNIKQEAGEDGHQTEVPLAWSATMTGPGAVDRGRKIEFLTALDRAAKAYANLSPPAPQGEADDEADSDEEVEDEREEGADKPPRRRGDSLQAYEVGNEKTKRTNVCANKTYAPGELVLVPLVGDVAKISARATTPLRIPIPDLYLEEGQAHLLPDVKKDGAQPFMPAFWLMGRAKPDAPANMEMTQVRLTLTGFPAACGDFPGPPTMVRAADTKFVRHHDVPVAANPKTIEEGEELLLRSPGFGPRSSKAARPVTWFRGGHAARRARPRAKLRSAFGGRCVILRGASGAAA